MNLDKTPMSNRMQIKCLGKTVSFDHGPQAQAALKCQNEALDMRQNYKNLLSSPQTKPENDTFENRQKEFEAFVNGKSKSIWG